MRTVIAPIKEKGLFAKTVYNLSRSKEYKTFPCNVPFMYNHVNGCNSGYALHIRICSRKRLNVHMISNTVIILCLK